MGAAELAPGGGRPEPAEEADAPPSAALVGRESVLAVACLELEEPPPVGPREQGHEYGARQPARAQVERGREVHQMRAAIESLSRDILDELPGLAKGQAIVSGMSINTPAMVSVRTRYTRHGGEDIDAPREWMEQWERKRAAGNGGGAKEFRDDGPDLGV